MSSILCVDDDELGLKVRVLLLQSFGFEVHGTTEPDAALDLVSSRDFDVVIVDYFLPTMTGTELARQMKQLRPSLLVLLFSGSVEEPEGLEHVDGFLCKAGPPQKLIATIRELIVAHHLTVA
jgi:CheY-like chemotaxis protein